VQEIYEKSGGKLHFLKTGIKLGKWQGSMFIPDHDSAMSAENLTEVPITELAKEEAWWYLSRLPFYVRQAQPSWQLLSYQGHRLGWLQQLPDESRNIYPNGWRIRMSLPA
jgi:NOL1/NOP2/fmu family ribosome biogenesis protein